MSWIEEEFETIDLGDKRLNNRVIQIVESLGFAPGRTIPQSFQSRAELKACYNFFSNDSVSGEKLLEPHFEKTVERIREYPIVLLLSDTTDLNYTTKQSMKGKERLDNKQNGLWLHATTAVTPERLTLGVVDANYWHRQAEVAKKDSASQTARDKAPIEEKESYRWIQSYFQACKIANEAPETQIINITDREGDIIELFEHAVNNKKDNIRANFIIRSKHDRLIKESQESINTTNRLRKKLKETDSLGEIEFLIAPTDKRKGRKVRQHIKAISVKLKPKKKNIEVKVNAVMAIEENPPEGEDPLIWIFITDLPIKTFDDACKIIQYYLCRWEIETFFKVLKSGCKVEERQLQTTDRMEGLISLFIIISWRVMFTMMLGRIHIEMSAGDIFDEAEWKSVYKIVNNKRALPRKPPKLGEFIIMIAKLGGYVDQKGVEPPGVKTVWKGMARMMDFAIAWEAFGG